MNSEVVQKGGILLEIGLILISGYLFGNLANILKLPRVSGYIVAGIVMSPHLIGIIDQSFLKKSDVVTHASLSVITFLIGSSLSLRKLRTLGKSILMITLGEAELAFLFVTVTMSAYLFFTRDQGFAEITAIALLFGALGSPTDPAASLAVIHEYRAKGVLTTSILGVAALDDAIGIANFVLGFSLSLALLTGSNLNFLSLAGEVGYEIIGAVILGFLMGYLMHLLGKFAYERKEVVTVTVGILFTTFALADLLGVDKLLSTMMAGITLVNVDKENEKFRDPLENYIEDFIFTAFFVIGSAFLNLKLLIQYFPLVLIFIISRFGGKYVGVYLGGHISGAPPTVKKNLAFALFPQGGIVIGLSLLAYQKPELREIGNVLVNVVIGATAIHEFAGPILSKFALQRAGEIEA